MSRMEAVAAGMESCNIWIQQCLHTNTNGASGQGGQRATCQMLTLGATWTEKKKLLTGVHKEKVAGFLYFIVHQSFALRCFLSPPLQWVKSMCSPGQTASCFAVSESKVRREAAHLQAENETPRGKGRNSGAKNWECCQPSAIRVHVNSPDKKTEELTYSLSPVAKRIEGSFFSSFVPCTA